jgi:magnesium chelatase subunit I
MHFGLLPRANRGVFAINELPDLSGKVQVGLFNIMQEGDVQIKGYPVRLPLDVLMCFSANPEDYTARGKIITPLKDRIGSEIRTHYPASRDLALAITEQEAWVSRGDAAATDAPAVDIPRYVREVVEEISFQARADTKVDKRSGVSQRMSITCLENVVSNAERRALAAGEDVVVPRVTDTYAALPSITGKFELEYEGELRGAANVAHDLIRAAVSNVFAGHAGPADLRPVVEWFEMGGTLQVTDQTPAAEFVEQTARVQGLHDAARRFTGDHPSALPVPHLASAIDFVLEGLYAQKKIARSSEWRYQAAESSRRSARPDPAVDPSAMQVPGSRKKLYN